MDKNTSLDEWIGRIRSKDAMTFEDAYFGNRPSGPDVIPRLVVELQSATDAYTRGKLCELLSEMGDASILPVLAAELNHPDESVRTWAQLAIDELMSPDLRAAKLTHLQNFNVRDAE